MAAPRSPRTIDAATKLLEQFAELDGQIATIEAERQHSIASINARADTAANDLIGRRDALRAALEPWWAKNAGKLTGGKRKSIELGGCMVGCRSGRASLAVDGDEKAIVQSLMRRSWAKALLKITVSLDKRAVLAALDGEQRPKLARLGLKRSKAEETFFVERTQQQGTLAG